MSYLQSSCPCPGLAKVRLLAMSALLVLISGCSISLFPSKEAQRIFSLPMVPADQTTVAPDPSRPPVASLKIRRPNANSLLNGNRVVIEIQPNELAAYSGIRWTADAPVLVRDRLVHILRQDPRLSTVVSDQSGAGTELTLTSTLVAFQEDRGSSESAVITLYLQVQLVENGSRRTLAARDFELQREIDGDRIEDTIQAFGAVTGDLSSALADWLVASTR